MGPIKHALLSKSREAALTAVQTYNNPLVRFKSESFIVLMTIAWTYLLHAYYTRIEVDYRYKDKDPNTKRRFQRTPEGGYKWWDLCLCIRVTECPLDTGTVNNGQPIHLPRRTIDLPDRARLERRYEQFRQAAG